MSMRLVSSALALAAGVVLAARPAHAWHIAGTVYCDVDWDGVIDKYGPDTPIGGKTVKMTSIYKSPGTWYTTTTNTSGAYYRSMPDQADTYKVQLSGLPAGWTVVSPPGGYKNVTLSWSSYSAENVNFLVQGCSPRPTTTTTTTSTTTTKPSTTSTTHAATTTTTKPTTTTTSSSTTTTTTLPLCDCSDVTFRVCRLGKFNNDAMITATVAANEPGARLRVSRNVQVADGAYIIGDRVEIGDGANVWKVQTNTLSTREGMIREGTDPTPALPLVAPCCAPLPQFACGGANVDVASGDVHGPLAPGKYGNVRVMNGATLKLTAGTYAFCGVRMGRQATIEADGNTTVNVTNVVVVGSGSVFGSNDSGTFTQLNVAGHSMRVSQNGVLRADVNAPNAHMTLGRDSTVKGTFCTDQTTTDKHIDLICPCDE